MTNAQRQEKPIDRKRERRVMELLAKHVRFRCMQWTHLRNQAVDFLARYREATAAIFEVKVRKAPFTYRTWKVDEAKVRALRDWGKRHGTEMLYLVLALCWDERITWIGTASLYVHGHEWKRSTILRKDREGEERDIAIEIPMPHLVVRYDHKHHERFLERGFV